ncbi:MAG TPA: hypothetical protein PLH02_02515 [Bacillota bacterium]|nr:hypothetical protein [Bacillota bacterium]HPQ61741.1 hypothetical protein [Bacillota bacterium]HRX91272.1 hypothetical protein [Candidatus Izemoplasmatales bacterium]
MRKHLNAMSQTNRAESVYKKTVSPEMAELFQRFVSVASLHDAK